MTEQGVSGKGLFKRIFGSKGKEDDEKDKNEKNPPVPTPVTYRPHGLKVVAEGTDPKIDIVAVHGLNGHREETWEAKVDNKTVSWLADVDMLPKKIPNARILVWGYDAETHSKDYLSRAYLYQHGSQLVGDLSDHRRYDGTEKRPIIFIGHSLGGIVIKSALIHSYGANKTHLAEHRAIKLSTYGIFFMGTPHSGGNEVGVNLGLIAVNIASVFVQTNDKVLNHLKEQSEWLSQQKTQYAPISTDFVTKFGWEVYPTPVLGGMSSMVVVPQWSAIGWEHNAEPVQIMANHITMVKFKGEDDPEYAKVWKKLAIMAREAEAKIEANWAMEEGRVLVFHLMFNKPVSDKQRLELVSRLTHAPADMTDNKLDDKIHLTASEPDVVYDPDADFYKAKSVHTLVGELSSIEEIESMRKHQEALLEAAERYERRVGDKDASLSTGIRMTAQHDWNDVLDETELVRKKYRPREGSNSITLENGLRTFETAQPRVEQWLALLPSTSPSASRLCGGLRMVLAIIWRSKILSARTYKAVKQIPITISQAQGLTPRYDQATLTEHIVQLYCAILDTLRHVLRAYSRVVVDGHHVHFEESTEDFKLIRQCERLIELEQQMVIDQRARIEALNYLRTSGDKQWDAILAVLQEQLMEIQDYRKQEESEEEIDKIHETSVNVDLYEALEYDHLLCHQDLKETMRHRFVFSAAEKSRVSWLVDNERLGDWITSPTSDLFLINGNETRHERTSPVSVYCGMLTRALQSQEPRIVLYWYCGLNVNDNVAGMLRNMIGQLLDLIEAHKSPLKAIKKVWYADFIPENEGMLWKLFKKILKQQLKSASVFCILDGVSFYEDYHRAPEFEKLVKDLAALVDDAQESELIFKVLLTSPSRSRYAESAAHATNEGTVEVLDMPNFVDTERSDLREFEITTTLSRRNSINSASGRSVYEEALEYQSLDDSDD
ncbi:hypothetical protein BDZ45DRAFT_652705 [Acephala macrosclerotiorum]|nr:hypothetical protein BDZ45DRAFT_652705 [Acephala macrosclerotiorum]